MSENIIFAVCFCAELSPFKSTESPIVSDQVAQARDVLGSVRLCLPLPCPGAAWEQQSFLLILSLESQI